MDFNKHFDLEGKHAFLSPSGYSWLGYDRNKMANTWKNNQAKMDGTIMHETASNMIKYGLRPADIDEAFNQFVLDAIDGRMYSEVPLMYSYNCFGTADAISFDKKNKILRIHDLKTGRSKPSFKQLYIYAALFCLEYLSEFRSPVSNIQHRIKLENITFIFRLYQGKGYTESVIEKGTVDPDTNNNPIRDIINHIIEMDEVVEEQKQLRRDMGF